MDGCTEGRSLSGHALPEANRRRPNHLSQFFVKTVRAPEIMAAAEAKTNEILAKTQ